MPQTLSVVMLGASGAVGGQVAKTLMAMPELQRLSLLNRRSLPELTGTSVTQHTVDVLNPATYQTQLPGHDCAVCTLGVGEPSTMSKEEFVRIDKDAVITFATACKAAGIRHFELLGSVGAHSKSSAFYLRTKGELQDALIALNFERLSLFQPSMILTPTNRYGFSQALVLAFWPKLSGLLFGRLRKYRGIRVETLGAALAKNLMTTGQGVEILQWEQFMKVMGSEK